MQRYLISCDVQVVLMSTVDVFVRHCVFACSAPTLGQILAHDVVAAAAAPMRSYCSSCCGWWLSDLRHLGDCEHYRLNTTVLCDCDPSGDLLSYRNHESRCRRRGASALGCGATCARLSCILSFRVHVKLFCRVVSYRVVRTGEKNYDSHFYMRYDIEMANVCQTPISYQISLSHVTKLRPE